MSVVIFATLSSVAACSKKPEIIEPEREIVVRTVPVKKPDLVIPKSDTVHMRIVEWKVVNRDNAEETFTKLESGGKLPVLFALDSKGYEDMSKNMSDIRGYIQQEQARTAAYDRYYREVNRNIDNANRK